ncbi:hypothetical protein NEOC65_000126 [Neochlamydia sp. AcF65]|nr:hypothetical protein [Neochlamydia sp. AcF65]
MNSTDAYDHPSIKGIEKIKSMITNLFPAYCDPTSSFIITNLKREGQDSYYCLVIQQKLLRLTWKSKQVKSIDVFDIEQGDFFVDGEKQNVSFLRKFQEKVVLILEELKSNRAIVFKGET